MCPVDQTRWLEGGRHVRSVFLPDRAKEKQSRAQAQKAALMTARLRRSAPGISGGDRQPKRIRGV
jgi:hypothetical protein